MTITHAISTERLVNVLQSIALKQQTGCLSVMRGQTREHTQEEEKGNIFFERGDTVFALTGQESGETALFRILKWKNVSYTFIAGMRYFPERSATGHSLSLSPQVSVAPQLPQVLHKLDVLRLSSMKAAENRQTPPIGMPALSKTLPGQLPVEMIETQLLPAIKLADIPVPTPPDMALPGTPSGQRAGFSQQHAQNARATRIIRETGKQEQVPPCTHESDTLYEYHENFTVPPGVTSIFRALPCATTPVILSRMERRERVVLLLLNGKRTLRDVALLIHHSEVDVARTLVRLLKQRYIEYIEDTGAE